MTVLDVILQPLRTPLTPRQCGREPRRYLKLSAVLSLLIATASPAAERSDVRRPGGSLLTGPARLDPATLVADGDATVDLGRRLFDADRQRIGSELGPHFDASSCAGCHIELDRTGARMRPGDGVVFRPVRAEGRFNGQINRHAVPPYAREAEIAILREWTVSLADARAAEVIMRSRALAVGPDGQRAEAAPRNAPLLFGWGLLERVDAATLSAFDDPEDRDGDGISGRARIRNGHPIEATTPFAVFGWKNDFAKLEDQVASALYHDMGITTRRFPGDVERAPQPELSEAKLSALAAYVRAVGVPDTRPESPASRRGEVTFGRVGCDGCHVPALVTAAGPDPRFSEQVIWPYSDLMLHDMGAALAEAGDAPDAAEWRTAPLWGLGVVADAHPERGFLHDGRATTFHEAILWHGGEAAAARRRYIALDTRAQADLIAYLKRL